MLLCYRYPLGDRQAIQNAYCLLKTLKYFFTSYICIIRPTQLDTRTPPPLRTSSFMELLLLLNSATTSLQKKRTKWKTLITSVTIFIIKNQSTFYNDRWSRLAYFVGFANHQSEYQDLTPRSAARSSISVSSDQMQWNLHEIKHVVLLPEYFFWSRRKNIQAFSKFSRQRNRERNFCLTGLPDLTRISCDFSARVPTRKKSI